MARLLYLVTTLFFLLQFSPVVLAHSGRTNSAGCHNCNVGSCAGTYHCHNGGTYSPAPTTYTVPSIPTCGANASYSSSAASCVCKSGYTVSTDKVNCVVLPANAHSVNNNTDAWLCDQGYTEVSGKCIEDIEEEVIAPNDVSKTNINSVNVLGQEQNSNTSSKTSDGNGLLGWLGVGVVGLITYLAKRKKKV